MRAKLPRHAWTPKEDKWLQDNYALFSKKEIAEKLGLNVNQVSQRFLFLKNKGYTRTPLVKTQEYSQFIIDNWDSMTAREIGNALGIKKKDVVSRVSYLRRTGVTLTYKINSHAAPVGTERVTKGVTYYKREDGKWRKVSKKAAPVKEERKIIEKVKSAAPVKPEKREVKEYATKPVDYSKGHWVRIDSKTLVFRKGA